MSYPIVAVCGRPNVGKSTLFNTLAGRQISIVEPTDGVTRDRVATIIRCEEGFFELVDTGGIGIEDHEDLAGAIDYQIRLAIEQANLILFMVDVQQGITPLDQKVAALLRRARKEVLLVANKADHDRWDPQAHHFWSLGMGAPFPVSAKEQRGTAALLETIAERIPLQITARAPESVLKMAIVGKRNAGKSTLINAMARQERMIVSEIPGTTRDSVDVRFEKDGKTLIAIDTAGIRRKRKVAHAIEFYSQVRAERAIRRCDVALLVLDATAAISIVDKKIADLIKTHYKPCILVINKWDLVPAIPTQQYARYLAEHLPGLSFAPIVVITARSGKNVQSVIDLSQHLFKQAQYRIGTGEFNRILEAAIRIRRPPRKKGRNPKIYYATQVDVRPPTFVFFVNDPALFGKGYQRFLANYFRQHLPFKEIPIRLNFRSHRQSAKTGGLTPCERSSRIT